MANAKKCDICGKLYEIYNIMKDPLNTNGLVLINIDEEGCCRIEKGELIDCCPTCMESIREYIKSLRGEDKPKENTQRFCSNCRHFKKEPDSDYCSGCPTPEDAHSKWEAKDPRSCKTCKFSEICGYLQPCRGCIDNGLSKHSKWQPKE